MSKSLSKSITIMFLFDLFTLCLSTYFVCHSFDLNLKISVLSIGLVTLTGLITLFLKDYYKIREFNPTFWNFYRLFEGIIFTHVPFAILLLFFTDRITLLKILGLNIAIIYILLCLYRLCFHYYLFNLKKIKKILIVGVNERAKIIADEIQNKYALKMNVVGFVKEPSEKDESVSDNSFPVYIESESLKDIIKEKQIDIVVIAHPSELILTIPRTVKIYKMPEFYEMATGKCYIDDNTIIELYYQYVTHRSFIYKICKRLFDNIAAIIILLVTLPITAYIAIRVKMTDGASPFFTQTRVGKDGKTFECYKLRTMYVNDYVPQNANNVKYAESIKNDDRIIPFCRFVRKARFDEIPQMINILKGEMSIVGPRAEWKDEVEIFKQKIPYYSCRMWIRTGWTGWSHINMKPVFSIDEEKERLAYDLYYIKHRNILWEIAILIKAVFLAISGRHK